MLLVRYEDWPTRLAKFTELIRDIPFTWGQWDCCLTACSAMKAITGVDPAASMRGKYKTPLGAARVLRKFAGGGVEEAAERVAMELGAREIPVSYAQRGDFVVLNTEVGDSLGTVDLSGHNILVTSADGAVFLPLSLARRAWRVG